MRAATAHPRMFAMTSVSLAAMRSGAGTLPADEPLNSPTGIVGQCISVDRFGGFGDVVSDRAQRVQIDFGVSPHASCWQITAFRR